jgi:hypothetical protein
MEAVIWRKRPKKAKRKESGQSGLPVWKAVFFCNVGLSRNQTVR